MTDEGRRRDVRGLALLLLLSCLAHETSVHAVNNIDEGSLVRVRRQGVSTPQLIPGPVGKLNVPIPTNIAVFGGANAVPDSCPRNRVAVEDGSCQQLLTQGNCSANEYVLLNPETDKGYCAPRLCPPDRIFIFSTQLCHDPRELNICPPGRELFESSYGTPVCQCPDGTYEGDDDLDDDVCEPLLGQIVACPPGQVFWFRSLDMGPECVPDPCNGLNLKRGPNDLPFIPSLINGKCFQMGASVGVCPNNTWYGLALDSLKGVCATLEEFGYNVFDPETLRTLIGTLGPPITEGSDPVGAGVAGASATVFPDGGVQASVSVGGIQTSASAGGSQSFLQATTGTQVSSSLQPVEQINQIQQQITLLQQQLKRLQDTLGQQSIQTTVPAQRRTNGVGVRKLDIGENLITLNGRSQTLSNQAGTSPIFSSASTTSSSSLLSSPSVVRAKLESRITDVSDAPSSVRTPHSIAQPSPSLSHRFSTTSIGSSPRPNPFTTQTTAQVQPPRITTTVGRDRAITFPNGNYPPANRRANTHYSPQNNRRVLSPAQTRSNVQIQVQPSDFIQIQHQNPQQRIHNSNSLELHTAFGKPFAGQELISARSPAFRSGVNSAQEWHGGGPSFIPNDSLEQSLSPNFFLGGRRKRSTNLTNEGPTARRIRRRRSPLPHAAPSNVFESRLVGCRGGAIRDINAKCRNTILPARIPKRPVRAAPPTPPLQSCNGAFNIFRRCVPQADAQNSVNAFALG